MIKFKWIKGRQGDGYYKLPLITSKWLKFDCYLLKFEDGCVVPWHRDKVGAGSHYRLNIILKRPISGGKFFILTNGKEKSSTKRIQFFRPDRDFHGLSKVEGKMIVLSFGKIV